MAGEAEKAGGISWLIDEDTEARYAAVDRVSLTVDKISETLYLVLATREFWGEDMKFSAKFMAQERVAHEGRVDECARALAARINASWEALQVANI